MRIVRNLFKWRFLILIYFVALLPRLFLIGRAGIYSDEITWMVRGKEVVYGMIHRNSNYFEKAWWNKQNDTEAIGLPLVATSGMSYVFLAGDGKISLKLLPEIVAARLPVAIISAFLPLVILFFGIRFFSFDVGLIAALIYAFNPVALGLDRWVVHDSFLTVFSFFSLSFFLVAGKRQKISILPGFFLALAFMTKPNGILPLLGWVVFWLFNFKSKRVFNLFWVNVVTFFVMITVFWPASWWSPIFAFFEYMYRQINLVQGGMRNFYLGEVTNNPGWTYYFFQLGTKLPEVTIIGTVYGLCLSIYRFKTLKKLRNFDVLVAAGSYWLMFMIIITFSPKKLGVRYALPLFPWIALLSAYGLDKMIKVVKPAVGKVILILLGIISLIYPISFVPDYYQYYNVFVGGPRGAQKYDLVGFCASSKPAFEFLNKIDFQGKVYVAGCADPVSYYSTKIAVVHDFREADLVVVETYLRSQHPEDLVFSFLEGKTPDKQFKNHGAVMVEIFEN